MTSSKFNLAQRLSINKNLRFCKSYFTNPSFKTFVGSIKSIIKNTNNGKLALFSQDIGKCISSISYFFNDAKWKPNELKNLVQMHMLKSPQTKIEEGDIASIDESSLSKKGDAFQFIGEVWDNADKCINSGYEYLAVAIISKTKKTRWLFDYLFYSNKDPKFKSKPLYVQRILERLFNVAKTIKTVVFDSGFKNQYTLNFVLNRGRNFIIRADKEMILWEEESVSKKGGRHNFNEIKKMKGAKSSELEINGKKGWRITYAKGIVNAWKDKIKIPLVVIIIKNPDFKNPLILVSNIIPVNFLEAFEIYETYLKRWKIEQIFQSIKEMGLEKFRVRKLKAIMRYLTIIFIAHSLLVWQTAYFENKIKLKNIFTKFLKKRRKIRTFLTGGMKIFYEFYLQKVINLNDLALT